MCDGDVACAHLDAVCSCTFRGVRQGLRAWRVFVCEVCVCVLLACTCVRLNVDGCGVVARGARATLVVRAETVEKCFGRLPSGRYDRAASTLLAIHH